MTHQLRCDECKKFGPEGSAKEAILLAIAHGWKVGGGKVLCEVCRKAVDFVSRMYQEVGGES